MQKAIVGTTLEMLKAKRNQKPEVRQASREAAAKEVKDRKKAKEARAKAAASGGLVTKVARPKQPKLPITASKPAGKGR